MKIKLSELNDNIPNDISLLICSSSFEHRWYQVADNIQKLDLEQAIVLKRSIDKDIWETGLERIRKISSNSLIEVDIESLSPVEIWRKLIEGVIPNIISASGKTIIDITTFSHEVVLFFVSIIQEKSLEDRVILAYSGASAYCLGQDASEKWLSRGVVDIRSVLGYPGIIRPSKKSHLVILVGFETERAMELITQFEPSSVSLGLGIDPYNDEFELTNEWHRKELEDFLASVESSVKTISKFKFSCSDMNNAKGSILEECEKFSDKNITVAPMNTKVSTIAAGVAAIEDDSIKLCYVEPLEYNKSGYSNPGDAVTLIEF